MEVVILGAIYGAVIGVALGRFINWSIGMWNVYTAGPRQEIWVPVTPHTLQPTEPRC